MTVVGKKNILFSWHGSASFSLITGGVEFLVDPHFSRKEEYGEWYKPNPYAPSFDDYASLNNPRYVIITHGHFDHFDLHTVEKLIRSKNPVFIGSPEVCEALHKYFGLARENTLALKPEEKAKVAGLTITAYAGVHWLTGEEGSKAAAKLSGRPERYGVMPCGGPMLGFVLDGPEGKIYVSGDTELSGIPQVKVDTAILYVGGPAEHPVTKVKTYSVANPDEVVYAIGAFLQPKAVIPVHYDFPYMDPLDIGELASKIKKTPGHPKVIIPPYNQWTTIEL